MHFLEFYSENILYMFQIGKLFIFRRQFYCTCSCYHDRNGTGSISIVVAASPHKCMIHTINCIYSKTASRRWIARLFETCKGCYQNEIQVSVCRSFYYTTCYNISGIRHGQFWPLFLFTTLRLIVIYYQQQNKKKVWCNEGHVQKSVSLLFIRVMLCQHFVLLLFRTEFISYRSFHLVLHLKPSNFYAIHTLHTGYGAIYFS